MNRSCPVVVAMRSPRIMPPERWIVEIRPGPRLGGVLKDLRLARGLSQDEVERAVGIDQSVLSTYERNARVPRSAILKKLNDFYEQPPKTLSTVAWEDRERREDAAEADPIPEAGYGIGPANPLLRSIMESLRGIEDERTLTALDKILAVNPEEMRRVAEEIRGCDAGDPDDPEPLDGPPPVS